MAVNHAGFTAINPKWFMALGCGGMIAYRRQESNGDNRKNQSVKCKTVVSLRDDVLTTKGGDARGLF